MFYRAASDQYINEGTPFTIDGNQYPPNWLNSVSLEEKTALGLIEVTTAGTRGDDKFYWVGEVLTGSVRTITNTPKDKAAIISLLWGQIKNYRDNLTQTGGYLVSGKWFHSDDTSKIQQLGLVMLGANIPANLQWKTMDGTYITMTQTLASQIFAAAATSSVAIFEQAKTHFTAISALDTVDLIAAYDWKAGWPQTYVPAVVTP
jgi:Domain of unknown function (DUF4376)